MRMLLPFVAVGLLAVVGCDGSGGFDGGTADLTVDDGSGEVRVVHDASRSQISVTPPAEGVFELRFRHQDEPVLEAILEVDSNLVNAGSTLSMPTSPAACRLRIEFNGGVYAADAVGSSGTVGFPVLVVDDATGRVEVIAEIDGTLRSASGDGSLLVSGFLEGTLPGEVATADGRDDLDP